MTEASIKKAIDPEYLDVKGERIKAIITIVVTAIVNVANLFGYALDSDVWINAILTIASFVLIAYSWWKNQNVTPEAAQAQLLLTALKEETKVAKHVSKE